MPNLTNNPFLGMWVLDPDENVYEFGTPPKEGTYTLTADGKRIIFTVEWLGGDDKRYYIEFSGIPDGKEYPYNDMPPVADTIMMAFPNERTLDSTAKKDGRVLLYARRVLSEDGQMMTVTQAGPTPDGGKYRNVSVYRRG